MVIPKSILEKLEPEAANISSGNPLLISIAISMKRIADVANGFNYIYVDEEDRTAAIANRVIREQKAICVCKEDLDPTQCPCYHGDERIGCKASDEFKEAGKKRKQSQKGWGVALDNPPPRPDPSVPFKR